MGELDIDGTPDEDAWSDAWVVDDPRQARPTPDALPSAPTLIRLIRDDDYLYIAVEASDPEPAAIVATQMKRDADLLADDHVTLVFDTFRDQRNGYFFRFNALGAREDGLIENVRLLNKDWDGLWRVKARRTATGWTAEVAIPWTTLNFPREGGTWGFNAERFIARRQELVRWRNPSLVTDVTYVPNAEPIEGFTGLRTGRGIEFRPYVTASGTQHFLREGDPVDTRLKSGFDLRYRVTPSITTVVTFNTDFAETEVDEREVNLTRFPIFFPEKRTFFLQDAGVFSFGGINRSPLPYYSRRVGLDGAGQPVDLIGGIKVSGRQGPVNFGIFNAWMEKTASLPSKELGVARVEVNVLEASSVGAIATWGDPTSPGDNTLGGLDFKYRAANLPNDGVFEAFAWVQHTWTDRANPAQNPDHEESTAVGWETEYDSNTWGFYHFLDYIERDYYPGLGRVSQTNIWHSSLRAEREFRPTGWTKLVPQVEGFRRWRLDKDTWEFDRLGVNLLGETKRGDKVEFYSRYEKERLFEAFNTGGIRILPGEFEGPYVKAAYRGSRSRALALDVEGEYRQYYGGYLRGIKPILIWRPGTRFNTSLTYSRSRATLPYDDFTIHLVKADLTLNFTPDIVAGFLVQWDSLSDSLGANARLRWTLRPGNDIFFVINPAYDTDDAEWQRVDLNLKLGMTFQY